MTISDIIINDQFMITIAIATLFLILAIARWMQKGEGSLLLDVLTWVSWFIVGGMHLLASPTTTPFYILSIFYWGIGVIFFILMFVDIFQLFNIRKETQGVGPI